MSKAPAFQFYVKDWLSDPQLKMVSHSSKGIWIDLLCFMWEGNERGFLEGTDEQFLKMLGCNPTEWEQFINEASVTKFADVTKCNSFVTVKNRRMFRDEKERKNTRLRVERFRSNAKCNATSNANVTLSSSSSSSSSKNIILPDEDFLNELRKKYTWVNFDQVMAKLDAWLLANPQRKKTRRFIVAWFNRIERPMEIKNKENLNSNPKENPNFWIEDALKKGWK